MIIMTWALLYVDERNQKINLYSWLSVEFGNEMPMGKTSSNRLGVWYQREITSSGTPKVLQTPPYKLMVFNPSCDSRSEYV